MFASVNGIKLFFDIEGAGSVPEGPRMKEKPVCFVLHGGPGGDHTGFKPGLSPLAEHMQLVYIDNRGSGKSEKGPRSTYTLDNNVEDIEALRKHLGLEKIVLLGQSYGGMTAMEYARRYQEHLLGLILVVTAPSYKFIERAKEIVKERGTSEQQEMAQVLWDGSFVSNEQQYKYYEVMAPLYTYSYQDTPDAVEARKNAQQRSNRSYEALNEGFAGFLREFDVTESLSSYKIPTLIIGGRHDWITPIEASILMNEQIPNSKLVIFENSSHSVLKDENDKFISTVNSFVNEELVNKVQFI
ncbi:alpha/beta fold hydrolase [Cytobacillus oceanisediminis]|uniref:Prolyl aminopeptidase n=1 Tax=Cytobacillus oceanisediminis TaxID=665099 RepID=A0ABX3CMF4_9BACI|nr:alpha/beta fold hydrolase [Cytobacillus oceanisediminis]OHX44677.1 prolyl aminopeptidase [Cytobacillus oceanisediminis]